MTLKKSLNLSQALYLAKEAGITTTHEVQKIILTTPSLSTDKSPFLISDIYKNPFREILKSQSEEIETTSLEERKDHADLANTENISLNKYISQALQPHLLNTFVHNNRTWLSHAQGIGTSKRSVATIDIFRGSGQIQINGKEHIYHRWPLFYNRMDVVDPFYLAGCAGVYDLYITVRGGGPSGQSKAVRLAIARALVKACPECHDDLQTVDMLVEDLRQKMPKMPGRIGARAQRRWRKR